jgi:hypothetical protein
MRRSTLLLGAVGLACAVAAGGSAFTAALTPPNANNYEVGFVSIGASGGTIANLHYTLDADGTHITDVTAIMTGDTSNRILSVGFTNSGTATDSVDCAAGTYDSVTTHNTTYACDVVSADAAGHLIAATNRRTGIVDHVNVALH